MADYAPPSGPPPPRVPEGWKALWNEQYHEWFYVNLHTKVSQWELPTQPAYPSSPSAPSGAPPGYSGSGPTQPEKAGEIHTTHPYSSHPPAGGADVESDAVYAARLQAEEDERARAAGRPTSRGAADTYYGAGGPQQQGYGQSQQPQPPGYVGGYPGAPNPNQSYDQQELPPREQKSKGLGGLLSKLSGKASGGSSHGGGFGQQHSYPQQGYGGYPPQGYPPQQHGYGGGFGGGGYGQPPKRHGGMGTGGAMALGAGGGLLGGAMLANSMGGDDGGDYGGDYGGDDGGGFGGDDGGGDFGGGDGGGGGD
ncbi:MAG: hypothetical protein Q9166_006237 [cf. Caloplaca sp. 2 TL-2023]